MMELIVLGQIPGTNQYLTFNEFIVGVCTGIASFAATWILIHKLAIFRRKRRTAASTTDNKSLQPAA